MHRDGRFADDQHASMSVIHIQFIVICLCIQVKIIGLVVFATADWLIVYIRADWL